MWTETDSATFITHGSGFTPDRATQIEIICDMIPRDVPGTIVELCCGDGSLSAAILASVPGARVQAFDGSPAMLAAARTRNPERFEAALFDLADSAWRNFAEAPRAVMSSLAIHHLDGPGKRQLFADMHRALAPGGALIVADLIEPRSEAALDVAAKQWDAAIAPALREAFEREQWNLYRYPDPAMDKPSGLYEQLTLLAEAGYQNVDVFYLRAGHAIFGGTKPCGAGVPPALPN
jgi:trans-aconitate methyltransferase